MKKRQIIYYLDIDNQDLYLFKHIIEGLGHKVFIYKDGFKMMQDLSKLEINPDILFLGNSMPILNGKELLLVLKNSKKLNDIPVVVISSALPKKLIQHYMNTGVKHIMKKTQPEDYRVTFKEVLAMKFA
jgi:CheY-like chemotaxis protein